MSNSGAVDGSGNEAAGGRTVGDTGRRPDVAPQPAAIAAPGLGDPLDVDPMVRSVGVPKDRLPGVPELIAELRQQVAKAGHQVADDVWEELPKKLLSTYRYLLGGDEELAQGGLVVTLGPVEALIVLDLQQPRKVPRSVASVDSTSASPVSGHSGVTSGETLNAAFQTGAHVQSHSGTTGAARAAMGASVGVGVAPVRVGVSLSAVANESQRSTRHVVDAAAGHAEDSRDESTLVEYVPCWSFKTRASTDQEWSSLDAHPVTASQDARLLLWLPDHYLGRAPGDQIVWARADNKRLPTVFYASGLTQLPAVYDATLKTLRAQGLKLDIGSTLTDELRQKLWNLDAHLDKAVNEKHGYRFALHESGRPVAVIELHTVRQRLNDTTDTARVGETSNKAHIENVRTAVDGAGGTHALNHSTTLSASVAVDIVPHEVPALTLGGTVGPSYTSSYSDSLGASRTGLRVVDLRYTGPTAGYGIVLLHYADVTVRGSGTKARTDQVKGRALLRIPEPEAFAHGFPVDRAALDKSPDSAPPPEASGVSTAGNSTRLAMKVGIPEDRQRTAMVNTGPGELRNAGRRPMESPTTALPDPIADGKGIGMGLPEVEQQTVNDVYAAIRREVEKYGFLPPEDNPFKGHGPLAHGNDLDSRISNEELLQKMVSRAGFALHWDEMHQDGVRFTLRRRRGFAKTDIDIDSARITITAKPDAKNPATFKRSTNEFDTVNLAMGMDTAEQSVSGSRKIAFGGRFRAAFANLRSAVLGLEVQRTVGATNAVTSLSSRAELLEFAGTTYEFDTPTDFEVRIEFQHSGLQGQLRPGTRDPQPISLPGQKALARVVPLTGGVSQPSATAPPPRILDHAVVYHLDTTGVREAATAALRGLAGPSAEADPTLNSFAGNIAMRAHTKEIFNGEYATDQPFASGIFRDTHGAVDISGTMGKAAFIGATEDKFVLGIIKLGLTQTAHNDTSSWGINWGQLDVSAGDTAGPTVETGGMDFSRSWLWDTSAGHGRTGGKELIQLDFHHAYAYSMPVSFTVSSRQEKHAKLLPSSHRASRLPVDNKKMLFLLSEPEALKHYADGTLPVTDIQLTKALSRWQQGELTLSGNVAAGVLTRWTKERPDLPGTDRPALAGLVSQLHAAGASPVLDPAVRDAFNATFPDDGRLDPPGDRGAGFRLPEYLTREDPGGKGLGHSGFTSLTYDSGRSTYQIVKELVDKAAPGLLAAGAELWTADGRVVGRMQGGIDALQGLLARGRDQTMWQDLLSTNGRSFYLVNPIGWLLSDVVEINLSDILHPQPRFHDFKPQTGLENYGHGSVSTSVGRSAHGVQAVTVGKQSSGWTHGSQTAALKLSTGKHRGTDRTETAVTKQTVYDWGGHYTVTFPHSLTARVRRVRMGGRPLNDILANSYRGLTDRTEPLTATEHGSIELQVPKAIAESSPFAGPSPLNSPVPLPQLPEDSTIVEVMMDDLLPEGRRLLSRVFGRKTDGITTRSNGSLDVLLSRSHLTNHLREATGDKGCKLADNLFMPGDSSNRATLRLKAELCDLQVIAPIDGSGTGRYNKHESGTTAFNCTDQWRPEFSVSGSGTGGPHSHTVPTDLKSSRVGPAGQSSGNTANYSREQHVKQQGRMYLVRMRARCTLSAERKKHHLFRKPTSKGTYHSHPVTGDVYAELYEDVVDDLRARLHEAQKKAAKGEQHPWHSPTRATAYDLGALLDTAAQEPGADVSRAHLSLARRIRAEAGKDVRALALTADPQDITRRIRRSVLQWAHILRAQGQFGELPLLPESCKDPIGDVIRSLNNMSLQGSAPHGPLKLPPQVSLLGMDPVYLARKLALEMEASVTLDIARPDGTSRRQWISPDGRVHAFDPASFDDATLTADLAQQAGLLTPALRPKVDALRLGATDLGALYRTSWTWPRTFEQAVSAEIDHRLASLSPELPALFDRACQADGRHRKELERLTEEHAAAQQATRQTLEDIVKVTVRLAEVNQERVSAVDKGTSISTEQLLKLDVYTRELEREQKELEDGLLIVQERENALADKLHMTKTQLQVIASWFDEVSHLARPHIGDRRAGRADKAMVAGKEMFDPPSALASVARTAPVPSRTRRTSVLDLQGQLPPFRAGAADRTGAEVSRSSMAEAGSPAGGSRGRPWEAASRCTR
ncbi:hypothetical protein [Streptomyces hygroscopicus]|uniref:hypothetical protein n=1 Tax=Streptomyces hygroscopicus TaxID=1912 RepID=UPI002240BD85|nr:hypothetical protein [Streptomyces hygroscopicus]